MKKIFVILITIIFITSILPQKENKGSMVQEMDKGEIDWTELKIKAVGIGAPNPNFPQAAQRPSAKRAAKEDAKRNLLEIIQGVHVSSETTVENFMLKDDIIKSKVNGVLKGYKEEEVRYMSDGTIEVVLSIMIKGELAEVMLPLYDKENVDTMEEVETKEKEDKEYTGIIIDAGDYNMLPCMAPRIFNEDNEIVYDASFVDSDYAVKQGVVGYAKDIELAKEEQRVSDNPYVIEAEKVRDNKMDLYISNEDAKEIMESKNLKEKLKKCRVMFVIK